MAKVQRLISVVLRLAAAAAAAAAAVIMVTSHETTSFFGLEMEAKYSHIPSLIFFVVAFAVACAYSLLVLLLVWPGTTASRLVLMSDVIIGMVLTGAVAATGAIAEVGKNGNTHAGWLPICGQVQEYCSRVMGALIAGFVALVVYFLIIMYSLHEMAEPMCSCHY